MARLAGFEPATTGFVVSPFGHHPHVTLSFSNTGIVRHQNYCCPEIHWTYVRSYYSIITKEREEGDCTLGIIW